MYSVVAVIHLCLQCQKLASNLRTSFLASISSTSSTRNSHHVHSAKVLVFNDLHWHRFRPPSATVVSDEPFLHGTGTLRCLQKEMATYRHWSVSLWRDPDDVSHCRILPLTKLNGDLSRLHSADEDAVSWLTNYGKWHAYEKKNV